MDNLDEDSLVFSEPTKITSKILNKTNKTKLLVNGQSKMTRSIL